MNNFFDKKTDVVSKVHNERKSTIRKTNTSDIVYAGPEEEFFYKDTDEVVRESDPIGIDIWVGGSKIFDSDDYKNLECELVLFENIYWRPNYD